MCRVPRRAKLHVSGSPGKLAEKGFLHVQKISKPSNNWRASNNWRPLNNQRTSTLILFFLQNEQFSYKNEAKNRHPKGCQLYRAPKWALILPNMVGLSNTKNSDEKGTLFMQISAGLAPVSTWRYLIINSSAAAALIIFAALIYIRR